MVVRCEVRSDTLRVDVEDCNGLPPTVQDPGPGEESGRGLRLVDTLAAAWGVIPNGPGKSVWFEVHA